MYFCVSVCKRVCAKEPTCIAYTHALGADAPSIKSYAMWPWSHDVGGGVGGGGRRELQTQRTNVAPRNDDRAAATAAPATAAA